MNGNMYNSKKYILRNTILFIVIGILYCSIELLFRNRTHWSMFILSGFCGICFIDTPNNIYSFDLDYTIQVLISTILCTLSEGICGLIVNIWLKLNVWDYSTLWGTFFFGQCNIFFVIVWFVLIAFIGIPLCDAVNYYIMKIEPCPYYKINGKVFLQFKERKE